MKTTLLLIMIFAVSLSACSQKINSEDAEILKQINDLKKQINDDKKATETNLAKAKAKTPMPKVKPVSTPKPLATPTPTLTTPSPTSSPIKNQVVTTVAPAAAPRVNIILIDEYGRVPECFKGVLVSEIIQNGKHTHFLFDGRPIDWNQKVMFSYSYSDNQVPITGTIYYTPKIAGSSGKVINIPPCNIYQDSDGTIRYDDLSGRFPCAPKGSGYITTQCTLPNQQ